MDLKDGKAFWSNINTHKSHFSPLEEDVECDVCIIGTGVSGANAAYFLAETGLKVVVVDKRGIGEGSTSANTGLLQYSNDKTLTSTIQSFGEDIGFRHYQLCFDAIELLKKSVVPSLDEDPDFIIRKSLYLASSKKDKPLLDKEFELFKKFGFPVEYYDQNMIEKKFGFSRPAALVTDNDAEVNPYRLVHSLLQYAHKKGTRVHPYTRINGKKLSQDQSVLYTENGYEIRTKYVIFSTGYEAQEEKRDPNAIIVSSYAIATNSLSESDMWYERMMIWETDRPYIYARTTRDHRIIMGGLDEKTSFVEKRESMLLHKRDLLLDMIGNYFPNVVGKIEAEFYWGAFYGETHDGLPTIGIYEDYPNSYFMLGYGGNGTVYSIILAQIIRDLITKGKHNDINIYLKERPSSKGSVLSHE
ncbi:NAD(P)/FAD-dependent oxidoreductase [Peribacillus alkalitolerans]|uniref:NAD(P)/FAD-dependent oxidoreductase n=1 Tax=Peribacillus alkalitolerans TaxID=1550385 RepID=UPI0013D70CA7|nr:FAD-dependent oxidoreductase [Peribacillus alkalitolerans]